MRAHLLRKVLPLGVVAVVAVCVSACDVSPPAATVNGTSISENQFNAALTTIDGNQDVRCALELEEGAALPQTSGVGDSTVEASFASGELSTLIEQTLVAQDVDRRHLRITPADLAASSTDIANQLNPSQSSASCSTTTGARLMAALPQPFKGEQVMFEADIERLVEVLGHVDVDTPALRAFYAANTTEFTELCVSQLVATSQAAAQADLAQIVGGTSFSDEAESKSVDSESASDGGAVGCFLPAQIGSTLASTLEGQALGQVSQPLSETTSSGSTVWVLLQVTSRSLLPFGEASPIIRTQLLSAHNGVVQSELERLFRQANVTTDPQYGQWNGAKGVKAPVPPPARFVLSPAVNQVSAAAGSLGISSTSG